MDFSNTVSRDGFCIPTLFVLFGLVLHIIFSVRNVVRFSKHRTLRLIHLLLTTCLGIFTAVGFYTLCMNQQSHWAWYIIGAKFVGVICIILTFYMMKDAVEEDESTTPSTVQPVELSGCVDIPTSESCDNAEEWSDAVLSGS
jgi:bacteriorhodopsin